MASICRGFRLLSRIRVALAAIQSLRWTLRLCGIVRIETTDPSAMQVPTPSSLLKKWHTCPYYHALSNRLLKDFLLGAGPSGE